MRKLFLIFMLAMPALLAGQVVNFAKTLPERAFSVGLTPSYYFDPANNVGLRDIGVDADQAWPLAIGLSGGYGLQYSLDLNARFIYVLNGTPCFGVDLQYLAYETRQSYFSVIAGLHRWDNYGVDLTGLYTWSPRYYVNFSVGVDMDLNYDPDLDNHIKARFWLPVNVGFNLNEMTFLFAEVDLQVSQWSWGIAAVGVNFILR
jgi:hypothetical protein